MYIICYSVANKMMMESPPNSTLPVLEASGSPPRPVSQPLTVRRRTALSDSCHRRTISAQRRHMQAAVHQQINAFDTNNIVLPYNGSPIVSVRSVRNFNPTPYSNITLVKWCLLSVGHFVSVHHCMMKTGLANLTLISFSAGLVVCRKVQPSFWWSHPLHCPILQLPISCACT